jgi:uncharacterized MAPEG superfamily protein
VIQLSDHGRLADFRRISGLVEPLANRIVRSQTIERTVMSIDLYSLIATALLLLVLALVSSALYGKQVGNAALMGNREDIAAPTGAARRAQRAHQNLLENAVPFAIVVLVATAVGASSPVIQDAAIAFVIARVIHAIVYISGMTGIRTLAWIAGVVATIVIAVAVIA